jgi:hypothetical protein
VHYTDNTTVVSDGIILDYIIPATTLSGTTQQPDSSLRLPRPSHLSRTRVQDWDFVERPQIVQDSDGKPLTLFLGQSYKDSHTLAIMFCQEGDTDCVTTVQ